MLLWKASDRAWGENIYLPDMQEALDLIIKTGESLITLCHMFDFNDFSQ